MPTDVDAILAYGYDLGGPGRWNVRGIDADVEPDFPWMMDQTDDDFADDFADDFPGFIESATRELGSHRRDPGVDLTDVEVLWYGSDTRHSVGIGYILAATHYSSYYSHALPLAALRVTDTGDWDRRLGHALDILQLQPAFYSPRWILAASHGI